MLDMSKDKQVNLNKLIFNGFAKLFEFQRELAYVPPNHPVANIAVLQK